MSSNAKHIFVVAGPTASGKTSLALETAEHLPIEIVSADSRQLFKYMDIGTAKPTKEEMSVCPHHFIDIIEPTELYSAGKFGDEAANVIDEIYSRGNIPLVVGGSGLYIKSLCEGFFDDNAANSDILPIREKLNEELNLLGRDALYLQLEKVDKESAEKYSDKNPRRVIRALEYYRLHGIPFSQSHQQFDTERNFHCTYFALSYEREALYERINERTLMMWQDGLADETRNLLDMGLNPNTNSLNTVGYKETILFLENRIDTNECIRLIQQNTRRYAKRQITWFNNQYPMMNWLDANNNNNSKTIYSTISKILNTI